MSYLQTYFFFLRRFQLYLGTLGCNFRPHRSAHASALGLLVLVLPKVSVCSQRTIILCLPTPIQAADEALALPMAAAAALAA